MLYVNFGLTEPIQKGLDMGMQSYMATVFVGEREIGGPFVNGDFRSSLNFARRELRGYLRLAESI